MSDLFLILHKVRGLPAFDIAEQMEVNGEVWWIIPTSGHRAYPFRKWPFNELAYTVTGLTIPDDDKRTNYHMDEWTSWPDHYQASQARSRLATAASDILSLMGLTKPKPTEPVKRRVIP
jgi:hypothetical protein